MQHKLRIGQAKYAVMCWERLGDEVRKRRKLLGLTQADVTARGGPSVETLRAIENKRAGRLSRQSRRSLERAVGWPPGRIDEILMGETERSGTASTVAGGLAVDQPSAESSGDTFVMFRRFLEVKRTFARQRENMPQPAREALQAEFTLAAREMEEVIVKILPRLDEADRGVAIEILTELRQR
jgi:transcriptional regulator with XRE-family HTH domain